ncbi:MAG TPA: alkaline phosphatase D family protein, partial [Kofleriaceae bacterium]|nr:alkaline phosphatase D family protein [Kofleriaceae bacterium]
VLVMSCCDVNYQDVNDMYDVAYRTYVAAGSTDLVLHIGDQVYGDQTFNGCVAGLKTKQAAEWPSHADFIKEQYRTLYRRTWNMPGARKLLANTMNLMIWDDHEVTDDWADRGLFLNAESAQAFVARCAWAVYREYQRQLWEDINDPPTAKFGTPENHAHSWDWLGVMFVDNRGGRAFRASTAPGGKPYLSPQQWGSIHSYFGGGGTLSNVRLLIVVTPVPLVFMGPRATSNWDGDADDLWGHWSHDPYREEQYQMLEMLRVWKAADPRREVVVVGGDVHIGGLMTICHREHRLGPETPIFRELIASAVRRAPQSKLFYAGYASGVKSDPLLFFQSPTFSYRVDELHRLENFGVLTASIDGANGLHTDLKVVVADE